MSSLNRVCTQILRRADISGRIIAMAMDVVTGTPTHYHAFIKVQMAQWGPLVKASGAKAE